MHFFKPELAFFDIDGTLVGKSGAISTRTSDAIAALKKKGVNISLATGRPMFGCAQISRQLDIDNYSLFSSGALIANPKTKRILFEATIAPLLLEACIQKAKELGLYVELYSAENYYIEQETSLTSKHTQYLGITPGVVRFKDIIGNLGINKIVTISETPILEENQKKLTNSFQELVCLCSKGASHPEIMFNNITSLEADRSRGFQRILSEIGTCAEKTIAFGDALSDLDFITLAAVGVAMEEAPQQLKDKANIIAESCENEGVAKILEQILDLYDEANRIY